MINVHSKYDNMHRNDLFYALICIITYVKTNILCILSKCQLLSPMKFHFFTSIQFLYHFRGFTRSISILEASGTF